MGVPWAGTGDVLTASAMLLSQLLSGSSLYQELELLDLEHEELIVANTGEHDLAWLTPGTTPDLGPNAWFDDIDAHCGLTAQFPMAPGPATLVAVCGTGDALKVVSAEGEVGPRAYPRTGTVNGTFRFSCGPAEGAWQRWVRSGVTHHSALARGRLGRQLATVSSYLGLRHDVVE